MRISTIIPAYNREKLIRETLISVLSQTVPPHEIIVVDDGSDDGTADVVSSFGESVHLIRQENKGAGAARNRGFRESVGDIIHFMDSDDITSLNTYETQLEILDSTGAEMVYGPWVKTIFEDSGVYHQNCVIQQKALPGSLSLDMLVLRGWVTVFQPCLFRRSLIEKTGPYREDLKPSEDSELLYRFGRHGAKVAHCPDSLLLYRVHPEGQVTFIDQNRREQDWIKYLTALEDHVANAPIDFITKLHFDWRKISALHHMKSNNLINKKKIEDSITYVSRISELLLMPYWRIEKKIQRLRYKDSYNKLFGVGRMSAAQKELIRDLGYYLLDKKY